MTSREIYQLIYNKSWIEDLEGQEIASFDVDIFENQWCLYKPKYTTTTSDSFRLQTQKNRPGDILLRRKNKPIGFKLISESDGNINGSGRKYQASISNEILREVLDGNVYDLKLYSNYGVALGSDNAGDFYAVCFEIAGFITNDDDEEFISLSLIDSVEVTSIYNYIDAIVYNNNFYVALYDGSTGISVQKFNISFNSSEPINTHTFSTNSFDETSVNVLTNLSYPPISTRLIPINGTPTEKISRIWTTTYTDDVAYLAYECQVPTERSDITDVTEGIVVLQFNKDEFFDSSLADITYYAYDTLDDISKLVEDDLCQAFIPEYTAERQSFGHSMSSEASTLVVGSPEEEAIYVYDLEQSTTPDLFSTPDLPANGVKILKDYSLEQNPVFPVRLTGFMDFNIFGDVDVIWRYPNGDMVPYAQASGYIAGVDTYYLFCDNFLNGDVKITAGATSGFIGSLNDIPNLSYGIDVSNTMASGSFAEDFQGTDVNIENTNVNQFDLETSAMVLDGAGNVSGTLTAKDGLPSIVSDAGVAAINALRAKDWNVDVDMPFNDIDPLFNISATIVSGTLDSVSEALEDPFFINGNVTSGALEYIVPDRILVSGALAIVVDGLYDLDGIQNGRPKWTKLDTPFNDIEFNTQWDIMHETPVSGTYYTNPGTEHIPNYDNWVNGDVGGSPAPTLYYQYD